MQVDSHLVVAPQMLVKDVTMHCHISPTCPHFGVRKTICEMGKILVKKHEMGHI